MAFISLMVATATLYFVLMAPQTNQFTDLQLVSGLILVTSWLWETDWSESFVGYSDRFREGNPAVRPLVTTLCYAFQFLSKYVLLKLVIAVVIEGGLDLRQATSGTELSTSAFSTSGRSTPSSRAGRCTTSKATASFWSKTT